MKRFLALLLSASTAVLPLAAAQSTSCTPYSAAACPSVYNPCCAYLCAEAQVPFDVCQPTLQTFLAACTACPTPTITTVTTSAPVSTTKTVYACGA